MSNAHATGPDADFSSFTFVLETGIYRIRLLKKDELTGQNAQRFGILPSTAKAIGEEIENYPVTYACSLFCLLKRSGLFARVMTAQLISVFMSDFSYLGAANPHTRGLIGRRIRNGRRNQRRLAFRCTKARYHALRFGARTQNNPSSRQFPVELRQTLGQEAHVGQHFIAKIIHHYS
jgi:hypothetical protein